MKINTEKMTATEKILAKKLRSVWNYDEFIFGVLNSLKSDNERKEVIEFIDNNEDVTSEAIDLLSLDINQSRGDETSENMILDAFFADLEAMAKEI